MFKKQKAVGKRIKTLKRMGERLTSVGHI